MKIALRIGFRMPQVVSATLRLAPRNPWNSESYSENGRFTPRASFVVKIGVVPRFPNGSFRGQGTLLSVPQCNLKVCAPVLPCKAIHGFARPLWHFQKGRFAFVPTVLDNVCTHCPCRKTATCKNAMWHHLILSWRDRVLRTPRPATE